MPLIVIVLATQCAEIPAGKLFAPDMPSFDIPVAPVVVCEMFVKAVLIQSVGVLDAAPVIFAGVTVIFVPDPPEHPSVLVPITVYVVVVTGTKETPSVTPPVHTYVEAPPPLNIALLPAQTVDGVAVAVTVGAAQPPSVVFIIVPELPTA